MNEDTKLTMAEFQPAEATLRTLADTAKKIDVTNIELVHSTRIELRDTRISLTKKGKELREGAIAFSKAVISKERDLLAIITPEEERLDVIEMADKQKKEMETRRAELPFRRSAIAAIIGEGALQPSDDDILAMDDNQFNEYRLKVIETKLESDRLAHERKVKAEEDAARAKRDEEDRIAREKLAAEKAEFEKQKKADEDKRRSEQAEIDKEKSRLAGIEEERKREESAKNAEIDRMQKEADLEKQKEADATAKAEQEKKEREEKSEYQQWLKDVKYDPQFCILKNEGDTIKAYILIGTYTSKK